MKLKQEVELRALTYGYKEANLFVLNGFSEDSGFSVPKFFGLSHQENYAFLKQYRDEQEQTFDHLYEEFCRLQKQDPTQLQSLNPEAARVLEKIRVFVIEAFSNKTHSTELDANISKLIVRSTAFGATSKLMIRSTGKEDNEQIANPGGNESFSNVDNNQQAISTAIGKVIASYFSEKSMMQRLLAKDDITSPPFMPVLLQEMIGISVAEEDSVRSGVMYTNQRGTQIQIAPGHGELVVNSRAPFDSYFVSSESLVYADTQEKKYRIVPSVDGLEMVRNKSGLKFSPSVPESVIRRLAKIGQAIEAHYGAPRDIEFVYDPKIDHIYIVQARPIPGTEQSDLVPSSVPPHKLNEVKKKALKITKGIVITPAKKNARVIINKNEVIVKNTLEEALDHYLHVLTTDEERAQIKAVLVKEEAPRTSHEAAQFNLCSIPVLALDYTAFNEHQFTDPLTSVVIIDPQRSQVIFWPINSDGKNLEADLFDKEQGILEIGLFKSSLPSRQTFFTREFPSPEHIKDDSVELNEDKKILIGELLEQIVKQPEQLKLMRQLTGEIFKHCLQEGTPSDVGMQQDDYKRKKISDLIEEIEAVQPGQNNQTPRQALYYLMLKFFYLRLKFPDKSQALFQNAMISGLELYRRIQEISICHDEKKAKEIRQELLDLTSKLSGMVYYQGRRGILSSSVVQVLVREELEQETKKIIQTEVSNGTAFQSPVTLTRFLNNKERFSLLVDTLKFGKLAGHEYVQAEWSTFAVSLSQYPHHALSLAKLLTIVENLDLSAEWLNKLFIPCLNADCLVTLENLRKTTETFYTEIERLSLNQAEQLISEWESKIPEWSDPNKFSQLFSKFQACFVLIDSLSYDKTHHEFTQIKIQSLAKRLTELMDESIKTLKGSPKYASDDKVVLRARNMAKMLEPLKQLMMKWVAYQPDRTDTTLTKAQILQEVNVRFQKLCAVVQDDALSVEEAKKLTLPSAEYSNDEVVYRPGDDQRFKIESFRKQIMDASTALTLEDIYTLLHQNTINSLLNLAPPSGQLYIPAPLQQFANLFGGTVLKGGDYSGTGSINCSGPFFNKTGIHYDFHCTLGKHHFVMNLEYDKASKTISLSYSMFDGGGGNEHGRYTDIPLMIQILFKHLKSVCPDFKVVTDNSTYENRRIAFKLSFNYNELSPDVISVLHDAISRMGIRTYNVYTRAGKFYLPEVYSLDVRDLVECVEKGGGVQLIPEISYKIKNAINNKSESGELPIFMVLKSVKWMSDLDRFTGLLLNPSIDYNQKNLDGNSLIECFKEKSKYVQEDLLASLLLAAIARSDWYMIQTIGKENQLKKIFGSLIENVNAVLGKLYAPKWHEEYKNWIVTFYLEVITNINAFEKFLPLLEKDNKELENCQTNLGNLIRLLINSREWINYLPKVFASPLCTSISLVSEYNSALWEFADNKEFLKMAMDSGKVTDEVIKKTIEYGNKRGGLADDPRFKKLQDYMGYKKDDNIITPISSSPL